MYGLLVLEICAMSFPGRKEGQKHKITQWQQCWCRTSLKQASGTSPCRPSSRHVVSPARAPSTYALFLPGRYWRHWDAWCCQVEKHFPGDNLRNNFSKRKSIIKRATMQLKSIIFWGPKAVNEKLSFDPFWTMFEGRKPIFLTGFHDYMDGPRGICAVLT